MNYQTNSESQSSRMWKKLSTSIWLPHSDDGQQPCTTSFSGCGVAAVILTPGKFLVLDLNSRVEFDIIFSDDYAALLPGADSAIDTIAADEHKTCTVIDTWLN
jgi:hypothetical protein